ncbi:conjugal transfer protein TraW [Novosphingobium sp. BL-52-GroH]|uniref:conjugal transfer protein TraW n=1 Tax=Novosphingobium sp. BL-52-GroH TaxID=3349877 RepID=UPI00384D1DBE
MVSDGNGPGWPRAVVWIAAELCAAGLKVAAAHAESSTIGRTWPIAEVDALSEIEAKAASLPADMSARFGPRSRWPALRAASLAPATQTRVRSLVPFYTLDMDITLPDGRTLYPKGFTFNPLTYVSLPQRLVVVHDRDLAWALTTAAPTDWIVLASGAGRTGDPVELGEKVGRTIFILEDHVKERLGLTVAPVIVSQVAQRIELREVHLVKGRQAP